MSKSDVEEGSGAVLALAVIGAVAALFMLGIPLGVGLGVREQLATSADAAALAGADVAVGLAPGSPCQVAGVIATANHTSMAVCSADGLVVTVTVQARFLGLPLTTTAAAGPPGAVTN